MKKRISKKTYEEMIRDYPIADLYDGWFFKYWEASNNHFIVEGSDQFGRIVSCEGSTLDDILEQVAEQARGISEKSC